MRLSWRELATGLGLYRKLDAIERQRTSDDARLKAVVESFLLGEGRYQPSWRMLIHQLHKARETSVAEKIKANAKPQQGEWVYLDESLSSVHVCGGQGGGMYAPLTC